MSLDPKAKALLRKAAREQEPTADDEARVYGALGKRIAAGGLAAAASAAAKAAPAQGAAKAAGLGLAAKAVAVVGIVSAIGIGAVELNRTPASTPGRSATPSVVVTVAPPVRSEPSAAPTTTAIPSVEAPEVPTALAAPKTPPPTKPKERAVVTAPPQVEAPPTAFATQVAAPPPVTPSISDPPRPPSTNVDPSTSSPSGPAPSGFESEIALLRESDRALREGTPNAALAKLDEHARRFPHGSLSEERTVSRIVVLCALGRTTEARAAGDAFLAARPSSPHAGRVRASCAGTSN